MLLLLFSFFALSFSIKQNNFVANLRVQSQQRDLTEDALQSSTAATVGLFTARAQGDASTAPTYSRGLDSTTYTTDASTFQTWALSVALTAITPEVDAVLYSEATTSVTALALQIQADLAIEADIDSYNTAAANTLDLAATAADNAQTVCQTSLGDIASFINNRSVAADNAASAAYNGDSASTVQYVLNNVQNSYAEVLAIANCALALSQAIQAADAAYVANVTAYLASLYLEQLVGSAPADIAGEIANYTSELINATLSVNEDNQYVVTLSSNIAATESLQANDVAQLNEAYNQDVSNNVNPTDLTVAEIASILGSTESTIADRFETLIQGFRSVTSINVTTATDGTTVVQIRGLVINNPNALTYNQVLSITVPEIYAIIASMGVYLEDLEAIDANSEQIDIQTFNHFDLSHANDDVSFQHEENFEIANNQERNKRFFTADFVFPSQVSIQKYSALFGGVYMLERSETALWSYNFGYLQERGNLQFVSLDFIREYIEDRLYAKVQDDQRPSNDNFPSKDFANIFVATPSVGPSQTLNVDVIVAPGAANASSALSVGILALVFSALVALL